MVATSPKVGRTAKDVGGTGFLAMNLQLNQDRLSSSRLIGRWSYEGARRANEPV